jgi:hypothetical protein
MVKSLRENYHEISLEFDKVVHDVREQSIEYLECSVNLDFLFLIDKNEEKVE